jgi:hypothetical protein
MTMTTTAEAVEDPYARLAAAAETLLPEILDEPARSFASMLGGVEGFRLWADAVEGERPLDGLSQTDAATVSIGCTFGFTHGPVSVARLIGALFTTGGGDNPMRVVERLATALALLVGPLGDACAKQLRAEALAAEGVEK